MPPPPLHWILLLYASFAAGIVLGLSVVIKRSRELPGALWGIIASVPLSLPAGISAGIHLWRMLDDLWGWPVQAALLIGPFVGSFLGAAAVSVVGRETGIRIAEKRAPPEERAEASRAVSVPPLLVVLAVSTILSHLLASFCTLLVADDLRFYTTYLAGRSAVPLVMTSALLIIRVATFVPIIFLGCLISGLPRRMAVSIAVAIPSVLELLRLILH